MCDRTPDPTTLDLFDQFIAHKRSEGVKGQTIVSKYTALHANLVRFGSDIKEEEQARRFKEKVFLIKRETRCRDVQLNRSM